MACQLRHISRLRFRTSLSGETEPSAFFGWQSPNQSLCFVPVGQFIPHSTMTLTKSQINHANKQSVRNIEEHSPRVVCIELFEALQIQRQNNSIRLWLRPLSRTKSFHIIAVLPYVVLINAHMNNSFPLTSRPVRYRPRAIGSLAGASVGPLQNGRQRRDGTCCVAELVSIRRREVIQHGRATRACSMSTKILSFG